MDNLWTRRSNSSKLSLSTGGPTTNGVPSTGDHPTRNYTLNRRQTGDTSSHSTKNPFNTLSPSTISSPTAGASNAFGLGSGAFASFGSSKTPKTPGGVLDFGGIVGPSAKTPTAEKQSQELGSKPSKNSLTESKSSATPPPQHNLRHSWAFWVRPPVPSKNQEYEKTIHRIGSFDTIEDFFTLYKHLKRPSTLPLVTDYNLFKNGIRPVWEDADNKSGGKWIVRLRKGVADRYWEDLLFGMIGDQFAEVSEEVCGAVLSMRNGEDILSIWTRNAGGRVLTIKQKLKSILALPPDTKIDWKSHDSSIQQRTAMDEHRKEKSGGQHNHHSSITSRNGKKEDELSSSTSSDKKQNS